MSAAVSLDVFSDGPAHELRPAGAGVVGFTMPQARCLISRFSAFYSAGGDQVRFPLDGGAGL